MILGPVNMLIMGALSDWWTKKGVKDASLRLLFIGFFILVPTGALPLFMPTGELAFAILCLNIVGIGIVTAMGVISLLVITPAQIRGQIVALYYLAISWFGSLGPIAVGELSSGVFGEENLRYAVASVPILFAIIPLLMMPLTRRLYLAQMARLGESTE